MKCSAVKPLALLFIFLVVLQSCKKEWKEEKTNQDSQLIQNFFKILPGTSPEVSMIADNWSRQKGFKEQLSAFVKKNGQPIWDKAFVQVSNVNNSKTKNKLESDSSSSSSGVVFIPLKDQGSNEIKSYVVCNKHADSVYSYRLYNKEEISNIDANNNDTLGRVRNTTLAMFAYFEKEINNKENIFFGGKTGQTINKIKISSTLQAGNTGNKGQRVNTYYCGSSFSFTTVEVYTDATTGNTVVQFNVTTVFVICAETLSGWDPSNVGLPGSLSGGMPGTGDVFVFTGGGNGGANGVLPASNGWWNYGSGYNGIYIPGTFNDPSNFYSYFNGPAEVVSFTDEQLMLQNLAFQLNLGVEEQWFLLSNLNMIGALYDYFANGSQSVTEKITILKEHISAMISNPDYSIFVQKYTLSDNSGKIWWDRVGYDFAVPPFFWSYQGNDGQALLDNYPNLSPTFQFPLNNNYATLYPRFTEMVMNLKTFVKENPKVMDALEKYSGLTKTQILDHLSFGQGPIINIVEMEGRIGQFKKENGNKTLEIRASYIRGLEQAVLQSTKEGTAFLLAVTILHEYVHYGNFTGKRSEGAYDFGFGFERDAFNVIVEYFNANSVVIKFSKYF